MLERKKKATGQVFLTYYKEPFTKTKLSLLINEFKVMGGCKLKWTPMDLRHSFAVSFLEEGGEMRQLQYVHGHYNVFDTKRLYAEVLSKKAQKEVKSPFEIGSESANRATLGSRAALDPMPIFDEFLEF
jgi:site-specific recombinase XerD